MDSLTHFTQGSSLPNRARKRIKMLRMRKK
jgi:hypothetical protein